jgi:hypothetical protein
MTQETVYRSLNGKNFDRPDLALLEDFHVLRHRLAQEVDSIMPFGQVPMRYEEQIKTLRERFKAFVEAGRTYIAAYQASLNRQPDTPNTSEAICSTDNITSMKKAA